MSLSMRRRKGPTTSSSRLSVPTGLIYTTIYRCDVVAMPMHLRATMHTCRDSKPMPRQLSLRPGSITRDAQTFSVTELRELTQACIKDQAAVELSAHSALDSSGNRTIACILMEISPTS